MQDFLRFEPGAPLSADPRIAKVSFTGSNAVGVQVMQRAAETVKGVSLELGGKSPCIIDKEANLDFAAKKVAWSKFINAGQTCVAPDYLLVHEEVRDLFVAKLKETIVKMYGVNPRLSTDFARIVSDRRCGSASGLADAIPMLCQCFTSA